MKQITKLEQTYVVGGTASAYAVAPINQPVCDLPIPAAWQPKYKGGSICVYPTLKDPKLINVQNINPDQLTTGFGG